MAKNRVSATDIERIQNLSFQQLGEAVTSGTYSTKFLRQAYSQMRSTALKRIERLNAPQNVKQFGKPSLYTTDGDYFRQTKNLTTSAELLRELKDVSQFLQSKRSTITGLRETRNALIERMEESGFKVSKADYPNLIKFLKWFKASEYSKRYDSDSPVVAEIFNTERANPDDWKRAFEAYARTQEPTPIRRY